MDDATPERWLPVPGYESLYEVSDRGRIWSAPRNTSRGGILKQWSDNVGRMSVKLTLNGKQKTIRVHVLVAAAFLGPRPEGQEVRHFDDNPSNNQLRNLSYGTSGQNKRDMLRNGKHYWANQTRCGRGHELTPENTYIRTDRGLGSSRACRACHNDDTKRRIAKLAETGTPCTIEDCERPQIAKGICRLHYDRQWQARKRAQNT